MMNFIRALLAMILSPVRWLMGIFHDGTDYAAQEQQERSQRADAIDRTQEDAALLAHALDTRAAVMRLIRGDTLGQDVERPVRWWLESLSENDRHAIASAQPDRLARVMGGAVVQGLPIFERSGWDGSDLLVELERTRLERLAAYTPVHVPTSEQQRRSDFTAALAAHRAVQAGPSR